ncbi:MAG: hypothetical protein JXX28_12045 [Deltaproteobacteria bacterium]|nr:hypothetical protein [Deltaproteobacteria bacterium]
MMLALLAAIAWGGALEEARQEVAQFPQDYSAQRHLALAACEAGERDTCVEAWGQAAELSNWNLEAAWGQSLALLSLEERSLARAASRQVVRRHPDESWAWLLRAGTQRALPPQASLWLGASLSARAVQRAARLAPEDQEVRCALAWNTALLGDRTTAREALGGATASCREELPAPLLREPAATQAAVYLTEVREASEDDARWKSVVLATADQRLSPAWHGTGALRYIPGREGSNGRGWGADQGVPSWTELWLGGRRERGATGASVQVAGISGAERGLLLGGRGWTLAGGVLRGEAVWGTWTDARSLQLGTGLRLPLLPHLILDAGVERTALVDSDDVASSGITGTGAASWWWDEGSVQLRARLGRSVRPVRLEEPTVWWFQRSIGSSIALLTVLEGDGTPGLVLGYEGLYLPETPGDASGWIHSLTFGVTAPR